MFESKANRHPSTIEHRAFVFSTYAAHAQTVLYPHRAAEHPIAFEILVPVPAPFDNDDITRATVCVRYVTFHSILPDETKADTHQGKWHVFPTYQTRVKHIVWFPHYR